MLRLLAWKSQSVTVSPPSASPAGPLSTLPVGRSTSASIRFQSSTRLSNNNLVPTYPARALQSSHWASRSRTSWSQLWSSNSDRSAV